MRNSSILLPRWAHSEGPSHPWKLLIKNHFSWADQHVAVKKLSCAHKTTHTRKHVTLPSWVHTWNFKGYHSTVSNIIIYWLCTRKPSRRFLLILWNKIICYVWHGKFYVELKLVNCWTNCQINEVSACWKSLPLGSLLSSNLSCRRNIYMTLIHHAF